jgi:hypothetical protein
VSHTVLALWVTTYPVTSYTWTRPVEPEDFLGRQMAPGAEKLNTALLKP